MPIQWFPGHMASARKKAAETLASIDVVIEVLDARLPGYSENPLLRELRGARPCLKVLNKSDLADPAVTEAWKEFYRRQGGVPLEIVATNPRDAKRILTLVPGLVPPRNFLMQPVNCLIVGIPNVGKSSLINALCQRKAARTGALPGLTRAKQWIRLASGLELLDTPGLLWPHLEEPEIAFRLAVTGAIGEGGFDNRELAERLVEFLTVAYPTALTNRFDLADASGLFAPDILQKIGARRGCLLAGGQVDLSRAADLLLQEFRLGKLGRFTLDRE